MPRPQIVIENPILNRPYDAPERHFRFDDEGITDNVVGGRRPSSYFIPIPKAKKNGGQLVFDEWTGDRIEENRLINQIRDRVARWRELGWPAVTPTTRALLEYWTDAERERPLFFCQIEALETAIYLTEAAKKLGDPWIENELRTFAEDANPGLFRVAHKMATGTGKTVVMAMLIAWHTLNKVANSKDGRFGDAFLVVAPGITIRDRLRVLLPSDPQNYYRQRDIIPADRLGDLGRAKILITNFHAFQLREKVKAPKLTKELAGQRPGTFTETPEEMVRRVTRELGTKRNIVVINDEAHHCYRRRVGDDGTELAPLSGEDKREAARRDEEARVWVTGLQAVAAKTGVRVVYDLSATPFYLRGSGWPEGTLFQWVVSDFSLIDAIEAGLVKIPRVPVDDNAAQSEGLPTYRGLWPRIRDDLPKKGRKTDAVDGREPNLPGPLEGALQSLYGNYEKSFRRWQETAADLDGSTPPVFIVVCNNTNVSKLVFDYVAGWAKALADGGSVVVPGKLALFSNEEAGRWSSRPKTVLVDSTQLESGDAMSAEFKAAAAVEIEEFKHEHVDVTRQPEQIKAFRDTWELGIHSYLAYLRDRLTVARELLTESGSCFVQIGDENVHLVRSVMDEVFGSENFVAQIAIKTTSGAGSPSGGTVTLAHVHDYLLWYARDVGQLKYRQLYLRKEIGDAGAELYRRVHHPVDGDRPATVGELRDPALLPTGARLFRPDNLTSQSSPESAQFPVEIEGRTIRPGRGGWKTNKNGMERLRLAGRLFVTRNATLQYVRFLDDFAALPLNNIWTDVGTGSFTEAKTYIVQTNTKVIQRCMLMTTDPGDLVLDPTCGSGTTAYVAEQWGRRWITIDTSRVALALARTRLMCARFPYYLLADSSEGAAKEAEVTGRPPVGNGYGGDVRKGFVYKRVPHVTLKSIAQNPDIVERMSRDQIETAIDLHSESEILVDQPYADGKKVRVTGRFTSESLSPHRVLDAERPPPTGTEVAAAADAESPSFEQTILDNLRKAGVHNTFKGEDIGFDRLDLFAGTWVQAEGEFTDADGEARRVAVSLGPEHGTVGSDHVKEAAKEAMRGAGFDLLVVCGFAFDPHSGETAREFAPTGNGFAVAAEERRLGRLRVLLVRMNPDLAMGGDLLKKTGAGNLFMVFGEPDVDIRSAGDELEVEVRGVDVYDPTTGEVRSVRPTTSPAGSSTPTTTARASSSATPTSPAATTPTASSGAPCGPTSTKTHGRACTRP
ncbi:MAG: DNA methyltransferase [Acidimicrobiales bacterium]